VSRYISQEVCPWNRRFARVAEEPAYAARAGTGGPDLVELLRMDEDDWDAFTRGSALRRAGHMGLRRDVALALGNRLAAAESPDPEATRSPT